MRTFLIIAGLLAAAGTGWWLGHRNAAPSHMPPAPATLYRCPMHPWITSDQPGKCTICGMDLVASGAGEHAHAADVIALGPSTVTAIGVRTVAVQRGPLVRTLRVSGTIDDDDTRHRIVSAWAGGRIEKLFVNAIGATMKAGEPMLALYSLELQTAAREFVQLVRAGPLASGAVPAARERLRRMGLTDAQLDDLVAKGEPEEVHLVVAPESGTVVRKMVYEGQTVRADEPLFEIADFSRMWFQFDAYEADVSALRVGQKVTLRTPAAESVELTAPIAFIDPNFDESTRTTRVRVVLPNPYVDAGGQPHWLPHRVWAEGRVTLDAPETLIVPRAAVLDSGRGPVAYVELADGTYAQRPLQLGRVGDETVEVLAGVSAGERVVAEGNLLIDAQAELNRATSAGATSAPQAAASPAGEQLRTLAEQASAAAHALAADDLATYHAQFEALTAASEGLGLPALRRGGDLAEARASFENWSTAVADLLRPHRDELKLKIYECPMAPVNGKARWVQREGPLANPFYGSEMLSCGAELR